MAGNPIPNHRLDGEKTRSLNNGNKPTSTGAGYSPQRLFFECFFFPGKVTIVLVGATPLVNFHVCNFFWYLLVRVYFIDNSRGLLF